MTTKQGDPGWIEPTTTAEGRVRRNPIVQQADDRIFLTDDERKTWISYAC